MQKRRFCLKQEQDDDDDDDDMQWLLGPYCNYPPKVGVNSVVSEPHEQWSRYTFSTGVLEKESKNHRIPSCEKARFEEMEWRTRERELKPTGLFHGRKWGTGLERSSRTRPVITPRATRSKWSLDRFCPKRCLTFRTLFWVLTVRTLASFEWEGAAIRTLSPRGWRGRTAHEPNTTLRSPLGRYRPFWTWVVRYDRSCFRGIGFQAVELLWWRGLFEALLVRRFMRFGFLNCDESDLEFLISSCNLFWVLRCS